MSVEERLRRTLADERLALPAWPDPVARVNAGIARRGRLRRLLGAFGAFGATLLALLTAAVWSIALTPAQPSPRPMPSVTGQLVPWKDSPVGAAAPYPTRTPRAIARPCAAADLAATAQVADAGAATGHRFYIVRIVNASTTRCTLSGSARLSATNAKTGRRGRVPTEPTNFYSPDTYDRPATIDPGEPALLGIVTANGCAGGANPTTYRNLTIEVLGRAYPLGGLTLQTTCKLAVSDWLVDPNATPPPAPQYLSLVPALDVPATARVGELLAFTVRLTNPTGAAVSLTPCPAYRMGAYKNGGMYWLNCPVATLAAHASLVFAMRIQLADYTPPGAIHLQWQLLDQAGASVAADAVVTVVA
jgi:hypothetical protein